jgi:FdhD protein
VDFESLTSPVSVLRIGRDGGAIDPVIREGRVQVFINGSLLLDTPALPTEAELLGLGALFLGGFLKDHSLPRVLSSLKSSQGGARVDFSLPGVPSVRSVHETLDCLAGKTLLEGDVDPFPLPGEDGVGFAVPVASIFRAVKALSEGPSLYRLTGCVHSSGFSDSDGSLTFFFEDISRRSAVDKVIGAMVKAGLSDRNRGFLVSSGRISSDVVARAVKAKLPLIASISAPTDRALEIARLWGITVCGFVRGKGMNIYTHPERVIQNPLP